MPATIIIFKENKGLVSYGGIPFQISLHNDEIFQELKRIDLVEKPLGDKYVLGVSISLNDEEHDYNNYDDIGSLALIGRFN